MSKINIIINYVTYTDIFNQPLLYFSATNPNGIYYDEISIIQNELNNYVTVPNYYSIINYTYLNVYSSISTYNFLIYLNYGLLYYYDNINKIIYIYSKFINIPYIFLGSINSEENIDTYNTLILDSFTSPSSLSNNYNIKINIESNSFKESTMRISGETLEILSLMISKTTNFNYMYYLYNLILPAKINQLLIIYVYDLNYIKIKNINLKDQKNCEIDKINFLVELINSTGDIIYSFLININYDKIKNLSNNNFVIFFPNYVNILFSSINLYVFYETYEIYFSNLIPSDYELCNPITISNTNLYDKIINSDVDLIEPVIPFYNLKDYYLNIDKIYLKKYFILPNISELVLLFMNSNKDELVLIVDYLNNYNILSYNLYTITRYTMDSNDYNNNINNNEYENSLLNNFLLNSMKMYIEFLFKNKNETNCLEFNYNKGYDIYTKLLNNNKSIDLFHKEYDFVINKKKQLIQDLLIIIMNYFQVNLYFYNNLDDLDNTVNIFKNKSLTNPYIKFNKFILEKSDIKLGFKLDQNYFLKFYLNINLNYKILIFKILKTIILDEVLLFITEYNNQQLIFKIFKINEPNGNTNVNYDLYYIVFKNIKECNEFIKYITTGILYITEDQVKSFFAINKSLNFKKNENNFYIITSDITNIINFQLDKLDLTLGNIFSNNFINYL